MRNGGVGMGGGGGDYAINHAVQITINPTMQPVL